MNEQVVEERTEVKVAEVIDTNLVPRKASDVLPLDYQKAFASYPPEEQQKIMQLSESIDVRRIDNVMHYGGKVLTETFDQCGALLKEERGSSADQQVMKMVMELTKKASDSYEDFKLVLKEPTLFQKFWLKLTTGGKETHADKVQNSAVTNFQLLQELKNSSIAWLEILQKAWVQIDASAKSDKERLQELEMYIIAGKLAEPRIEEEMALAKAEFQQTGLQIHAQVYEEIEEGSKDFALRMANLEKSRVMYRLSLGQLTLIKRSNRSVQTSIHTQTDNSLALMAQELRNALLDAKNREVMEGQKAISRLNDELIREVSRSIGLTAEETEQLIYKGFFDIEAAKTACTTVVNACKAVHKIAEEALPKLKAETAEINALIGELEPYVNSVKTSDQALSANAGAPSGGNGKLEF